MGITSEKFFENVYNVIFSPKEFFESENMQVSARLAAGIIAVMAAVNKYTYSISEGTVYTPAFILTLIWSIVCSLFIWIAAALFFEYTAKIFDRSGNFIKVLYLSAYALVPAVLFAPLSILKQTSQAGYIIAVILSCLLYIRLVFLYAYALKSAYNITFARAFMLVFLPAAAAVPAVFFTFSFWQDMRYIFSI